MAQNSQQVTQDVVLYANQENIISVRAFKASRDTRPWNWEADGMLSNWIKTAIEQGLKVSAFCPDFFKSLPVTEQAEFQTDEGKAMKSGPWDAEKLEKFIDQHPELKLKVLESWHKTKGGRSFKSFYVSLLQSQTGEGRETTTRTIDL